MVTVLVFRIPLMMMRQKGGIEMLSQEQVKEPRGTASRHGKTTACSLCAAHEKCSHQAEGQEQPSEPQVRRWATPPYDLVVGQDSSAFQLACAKFCRQSEH